jgi:hypothetical protein
MRNVAEVVEYLAYRIGVIYYHDRPLMYGGTPDGVELLLYTYHDIWAQAAERESDLESVWRDALKQEDCGSANFSGRYSYNNPDADDVEVADYVLHQWRRISKSLAVPIPHERLEKDFAEHIQVQKKRFSW